MPGTDTPAPIETPTPAPEPIVKNPPIPPTPTPPPPSPKTSHKLLLLIFTAIAFAALGIASYFVYQNYLLKQSPPATQPTPTSTSETSTPTSDPTADWKTYTNINLGFQLKHPSNWDSCETQGLSGYLIDTNQSCAPPYAEYQIKFTVIENAQIIEEYNPPGETTAYQASGQQEITLGTNQFTKQAFNQIKPYTWNGQEYLAGSLILFYDIVDTKNNRILEFYTLNTTEEMLNQILSTFKFIENTSEWKTDINIVTSHSMGMERSYAYIVKYPSNWLLSKDVGTHNSDTLITQCTDYIITSPSKQTKLSLQPICTSYLGTRENLPAKYNVVKNLGQIGNDMAYKYYIRFQTSGINNYQYGTVSSNSSEKPVSTDEINKHVLVSYVPDDLFFIPTTIKVTAASTEDLQIADQIVAKLLLERK